MKRSFAISVFLPLAALASAQSRSAFAVAAAGNVDTGPSLFGFQTAASGGSAVAVNPNKSFSGYDSDYDVDTMVFSGSATGSAEYGRLHTSVDGKVANTIY